MNKQSKSFVFGFCVLAILAMCACLFCFGGIKQEVRAEVGHTISFNANGGSGTMNSVNCTEDEYELPECDFVEPTYQEFDCWAIGSVSGEQKQAHEVISVTEDVVLFAIWKSASHATEFSVEFNAHGGSGTMSAVENVESLFAVPNCSFIAPENKEFSCWAVNFLEGEQKFVGDIIEITKNTVLYAIWKDIPHQTEFSVEFDANGGSGTMEKQERVLSEYIVPECTFTAPIGKVFSEYKIDGEDVFVPVGAILNVTKNIRLIAYWVDNSVEIAFSYADEEKQIGAQALQAKELGKALIVKIDDCTICFNQEAVQSFDGELSDVLITFDIRKVNFRTDIKGAKKVVNIALSGTSFSSGEVCVTIPIDSPVPKNQIARVYFVGDNHKTTKLITTTDESSITFATNHFSSFVLAYQDKDASSLPTWAFILIAIAVLIAILLSGFAIYWFGIKKHTLGEIKHLFKKKR